MKNLMKPQAVAERWHKCERFVRNRTSLLWTTRHNVPRLSFVRMGNRLLFREADILEYEQRFVKGTSKNEASQQ
jgi:hypothetical protein